MPNSFFNFHDKLVQRRSGLATAVQTNPLTVSQLTAQIEKVIRGGFPAPVLVKGEISNFNRNRSSGHFYFTLKDADTCIDCVIFRQATLRLKFEPTDGMELIADGRVCVYGPRGRYQLQINTLQPLGQGALELAFQQLRAKLEAEGLFTPQRKRPLPNFPMRLALVTGRETAAVKDMLKVLAAFRWVKIFIYNVPVQGEGCAEKIAAALDHVNLSSASLGGIDLILLGRGGGSLEDLWQFNEEAVARAVARSQIQIITGIGHEVDVSIADLVADYHAHTPTEAAQVAMAQWRGVKENVEMSRVRLRRGVRTLVGEARRRLISIERHEAFRRPMDQINNFRQLLDDRQRGLALHIGNHLHGLRRTVEEMNNRLEIHRPQVVIGQHRQRLATAQQRLAHLSAARLLHASDRLARLTTSLGERHPRHALRLNQQRLASLALRFDHTLHATNQRHRAQLDAIEALLRAISVEQVLRRGYSITTRKRDGRPVRSAAEIKEGERLVTRLADGEIESIVQDRAQLPLFE